MHEPGTGTGRGHQLRVDAVRPQPATRCAHTSRASPIDTHMSVCTKSTPLTARRRIVGDRDRGPCACAMAVATRPPRLGWSQLAGPPRRRSAPEQRSGDEVGAGHVEAEVSEERIRDRPRGLARDLSHRQEVGEHLGRMPLVGETVVHGHPGVGAPAPRCRPVAHLGTGSRRTSAPAPARCRRSTPCGRSGTQWGRSS